MLDPRDRPHPSRTLGLRALILVGALWAVIATVLRQTPPLAAEPAALPVTKEPSNDSSQIALAELAPSQPTRTNAAPGVLSTVESPARQQDRPSASGPTPDLASLFADLCNDRYSGNAAAAMRALLAHATGDAEGRRTIHDRAEWLMVGSPDGQQARLCAELLLHLTYAPMEASARDEPHPELLDYVADWSLRLATASGDYHYVEYQQLHELAFRFAVEHSASFEQRWLAELRSERSTTRQWAAVALACAGHDEHAGALASVLRPHLRDNRVPGDAMRAAFALVQLGPRLLPHLSESTARDDQERSFLRAIRAEIERPGGSLELGLQRHLGAPDPRGPAADWRLGFWTL